VGIDRRTAVGGRGRQQRMCLTGNGRGGRSGRGEGRQGHEDGGEGRPSITCDDGTFRRDLIRTQSTQSRLAHAEPGAAAPHRTNSAGTHQRAVKGGSHCESLYCVLCRAGTPTPPPPPPCRSRGPRPLR